MKSRKDLTEPRGRTVVQFYPDRPSLDRSGTLDTLLGSANEVKAVLVGGSGFITHRPQNARRVSRAILPHPQCGSLVGYSKTTGDFPGLSSKIAQTTKHLQDFGINVRWYPEMICHTLLIGDPQAPSGWAKFESVLPYADFSMRPNIIVRTREHPEMLQLLDDVFQKMWLNSSDPDKITLSNLLKRGDDVKDSSDIVIVNPNFYGIGINVREACQRLQRWLTRR